MTIPEQAVQAETLWAVNIHGPDDLVAAPDYLSAVRMSNAFNAWWLSLKMKQPHNDAIDARMWAVPTDWPENYAQEHAYELSKPHPEYQWLRDASAAPHLAAVRVKKLNGAELEEAIRLAEIGEYLYNRSYSYGDGYSEPREYGIEWQWQQTKPNEFGEGALLGEATRWHKEQAEDGVVTEASKLRRSLHTLSALEPSAGRAAVLEEAATLLEREACELDGLVDSVAHHLRSKAKTIRALASYPVADVLEEGDLNARLKAKGMYSIEELLGELPLDRWRVHSGMNDLKFFGEWIERKAREYLTMKAAYDVGDKDESDELYEWVLAHYGAFHDVLVNYRAAIAHPVADKPDEAGAQGEGIERKFQLGDRVTKNKGSSWTGRVVGFYSTELTPTGYAVESETEIGSVQIYPEAALRLVPTPPSSEVA